MFNKVGFLRRLFIGSLLSLVGVSAMSQDLQLDLTATSEIAAGEYDLDTQYMGSSFYGRGNVAGIYQLQTDGVDMGNVAEIQQIDGVTNLAMIWQQGFNNEAHIFQEAGENNVARLSQLGSGHYAYLSQSGGSDNTMFVQMVGTSARIEASQVDAISNSLWVVLNAGSQLFITQTGEGNNFSTVLSPGTIMTVIQTGP